MSNETIEKMKLAVAEMQKNVAEFLKFGKHKLKFGEMMTSDGKMISYDGELAEGSAVMIDGGPAADGAYTLEDGTVCNVKDGKIESLVKPEAGEDYTDKFAAIEKRFTDFEAKYEDANKTISEQFETIGKALSGITDQMGKQLELVGKFAAQEAAPAEPPVSRKIQKIEKDVKAAKLVDQILDEINKSKNN